MIYATEVNMILEVFLESVLNLYNKYLYIYIVIQVYTALFEDVLFL